MTAVRVRFALLLAGVFVASAIVPVPVAAATSTTTTVSLDTNIARLEQQIEASVTVFPTPPYPQTSLGGSVRLMQVMPDDSRVFVKTVGIIQGGIGTFTFSLPRVFGTNTYIVEYSGYSPADYDPSESEPFDMTYTAGQSYMEIYPLVSTVEQNTPLVIDIGLYSGDDTGGTVRLFRVGSATPLCELPRSTEPLRCEISSTIPTGAQQFYGSYDGTAEWLGTQSENVSVTIVADVLHGTINAPEFTTFYPVKDTYRDTVKLSGNRSETISGTVKIYTPGGTLIKTYTVPASVGAYSFAWDGRKTDGTIRPEGKYKVVTALKDAGNVAKSATQYVTLSKKKLIWHAGSVTKKGSSFSASGRSGAGAVSYNTTSGYVRLKAPDGYSGDWAGAGWQFTLTSGVAWKSIVVKVYAKHSQVFQSARLGSQNFSTCSYVSGGNWGESCFDSWKNLGGANGSLVWTSTATLTSTHRSGDKVRSTVSVRSADVYVYKARVTFQYATLGY